MIFLLKWVIWLLQRYDQEPADLYITRNDNAGLEKGIVVDFSRTWQDTSTSGATAGYTTFQLKDKNCEFYLGTNWISCLSNKMPHSINSAKWARF